MIKVAPLLRRLRREDFVTVCTAQQNEQIPSVLDELALPEPDLWLARGYQGKDLSQIGHIPRWLFEVRRNYARNRPHLYSQLASGPGRPLVVVHGDTFSTVLGAMMGRGMGLPVAHIEAGLRSFNLRHPFPEELDRLATSRLARIHFAPGDTAESNLRHARGEVINIGANTVKDSLDLVPDDIELDLPISKRFGVVSVHRNELIQNKESFRQILGLLKDRSYKVPLLFIDHSPTIAAIARQQLQYHFDDQRFVRIPKLSYFKFISLLKRSEFLVTDSGGVQEECYYLNHPCLVHRLATERGEGLGQNVLLSGLALDEVSRFLDDPGMFRMPAPPDVGSPTSVIIDHLMECGFTTRNL